MSSLIKTDPAIAKLIAKEKRRQADGIELIASENYVSKAVYEALATPFTNKYSEGYPGKRYYGGNQVVDEVEALAIERAKKLFGAEHVNVQPLSGGPANVAVYLALLKPGDTILSMHLDHGGHLSHGLSVNFSGLFYKIVPYGIDPKTGYINMDEVERLAVEAKPKLIIAGFSAYSRNLEWKRFREIADKVSALLMADIAHIAGFIAAQVLENPVPFCDVVTTTTHKTLRGPRGAIIMCKEKYAKAIDRAVFPGLQGGPHDHVTAAKAVCFKEAMAPSFKRYAKQVIKNAQVLASGLIKHGFTIISGGTDNHLMLIDLRSKHIDGETAVVALDAAGISTNKNKVPGDPGSAQKPSGLRLGTPAVTTRGMKEREMRLIAEWIDQIVSDPLNEALQRRIRFEVRALAHKFPIPL
ncbi:MAG: serine hydroxymethyltransferase [Parcubacteria group bacterium]|nr:serine hydroxymethyltransferase [Parcubacteria group bacterium]